MKRVLQIVAVALALALGAGTAQASVIARFSWTDDYLFNETTFRLTNESSGGLIDQIFVDFSEFGAPGVFVDAQMSPTTIYDAPVIVDPLDPTVNKYDQAFNLNAPLPGTVEKVRLSFRFIDVDQQVRRFRQTYDATMLLPEVWSDDQVPPPDDWSPSFWAFAVDLDSVQTTIPEPASLTLLGLGLATAVVRRRRL